MIVPVSMYPVLSTAPLDPGLGAGTVLSALWARCPVCGPVTEILPIGLFRPLVTHPHGWFEGAPEESCSARPAR
jgi:hypothetical protein